MHILISTHMCSDTTDDHAADDDTVTALDLRIVKASESVDLFSDRDVLAEDASRSGPIRNREQQGPVLISHSKHLRNLGVIKICTTKMHPDAARLQMRSRQVQLTPHQKRTQDRFWVPATIPVQCEPPLVVLSKPVQIYELINSGKFTVAS